LQESGLQRFLDSIRREVREVPLDAIDPPSEEVRLAHKPQELEELARSIQEVGLINPLIVKETAEHRYEIISGHRRYLACKLAGLHSIPCIVVRGEDQYFDALKLQENIHRKDLNPIEESNFFHQLIEKYGYTINELCRITQKSRSYIKDRLDIANWPEDVLDLLWLGTLNLSQCKELAKVQDQDLRKRMTEWAVKGGATAQMISQWRREYEILPQTMGQPAPSVDELPPPSEPPKAMMVCDWCESKFEVARVRIIRMCPQCWEELRYAKATLEERKGAQETPTPRG